MGTRWQGGREGEREEIRCGLVRKSWERERHGKREKTEEREKERESER